MNIVKYLMAKKGKFVTDPDSLFWTVFYQKIKGGNFPYTPIEYVICTGEQLCNTYVKMANNIRIDAQVALSGGEGYQMAVGAYYKGTGMIAQEYGYGIVFDMDNYAVQTWSNTGGLMTFVVDADERLCGDSISTSRTFTTATVNGTTVNASYTLSTFLKNKDIYIGGSRYNAGNIEHAFCGRIYGIQIYDNATLILDLKPCTYEGEVGFYDTLTLDFYSSSQEPFQAPEYTYFKPQDAMRFPDVLFGYYAEDLDNTGSRSASTTYIGSQYGKPWLSQPAVKLGNCFNNFGDSVRDFSDYELANVAVGYSADSDSSGTQGFNIWWSNVKGTATEFKNWLTAHPVKVLYELYDPDNSVWTSVQRLSDGVYGYYNFLTDDFVPVCNMNRTSNGGGNGNESI